MNSTERARAGRGFTLVELLIVMVIIGILMALILQASMGGIRQAERRATESLIIKLETAMMDRLDALTSTKVQPTFDHGALAATYFATATTTGQGRAQVWAQYDYLRAELPDVWIPNGLSAKYPINFGAGTGYPGGGAADIAYMLPIGAGNTVNPAGAAIPTGIWGASFAAAGGIYKQLGYLNKGYNAADDSSPPDGFPDDIGESGTTLAAVKSQLAKHTHKTARSEMLYAILVEGTGPMGSAFSRDDFTTKEVQDTDGDGLLEFVDAWGEPLQFYRWPIFYHSDFQKGVTSDSTMSAPTAPYQSVFESREQSPIDPNQQLMSVTWWSGGTGCNTSPPGVLGFSGSGPLSAGAVAFQRYFHLLIEPASSVIAAAPTTGAFWDRGAAFYQRRAFYCRPLIISGGEDRHVGIARLDQFGLPVDGMHAAVESQARQCDFSGAFAGTAPTIYGMDSTTNFNPLDPTTQEFLQDAAADDISTHNILAAGGALR